MRHTHFLSLWTAFARETLFPFVILLSLHLFFVENMIPAEGASPSFLYAVSFAIFTAGAAFGAFLAPHIRFVARLLPVFLLGLILAVYTLSMPPFFTLLFFVGAALGAGSLSTDSTKGKYGAVISAFFGSMSVHLLLSPLFLFCTPLASSAVTPFISPEKETKKLKPKVIDIAFFLFLIAWFLYVVSLPIYTIFSREVDPAYAPIPIFFLFVGYTIAELLLPSISPRFGLKGVALMGLLINATLILIQPVVITPLFFIVLMLLVGCSAGMSYAAFSKITSCTPRFTKTALCISSLLFLITAEKPAHLPLLIGFFLLVLAIATLLLFRIEQREL